MLACFYTGRVSENWQNNRYAGKEKTELYPLNQFNTFFIIYLFTQNKNTTLQPPGAMWLVNLQKGSKIYTENEIKNVIKLTPKNYARSSTRRWKRIDCLTELVVSCENGPAICE